MDTDLGIELPNRASVGFEFVSILGPGEMLRKYAIAAGTQLQRRSIELNVPQSMNAWVCAYGDIDYIVWRRCCAIEGLSGMLGHPASSVRRSKIADTEVPVISVIDDDESLRDSLEGVLSSLNYAVCVFSGAEDFLTSTVRAETSCIILDVRMPGMSGPELQTKLIASGQSLPIIFITAHGDEDVVSRVMADGAVACLLKPFSEEALLNAIDRALSR